MYPLEVKQQIVAMVPGLTGIGSIVFRDEEAVMAQSSKSFLECYRNEIAPYKGELELWYARNQSLWVDLKIVLLTAWMVLFPNSLAYEAAFPSLPSRSDASLEECSGKAQT
jgi:lipopolysaccharide/colanic/teichoic acid biosynthesis glycosyltransferase